MIQQVYFTPLARRGTLGPVVERSNKKVSNVLARSCVEYPTYPQAPESGKLTTDHAALIASARAAIYTTGKMSDADPADLFTDVSRGMDKPLWLIEAHAQSKY